MSRTKFGKTPTPFGLLLLRRCTNTSPTGTTFSPQIPCFLKSPPRGLRDYTSLSEQERVKFVAAFMSFLSYSQNAFLKWRQKLLAPELWLGWEFVIMNLVCAPGGKAFWKDRGYMFGEEFRRYLENDLMKREPHPDTKPLGAFPNGQRAV